MENVLFREILNIEVSSYVSRARCLINASGSAPTVTDQPNMELNGTRMTEQSMAPLDSISSTRITIIRKYFATWGIYFRKLFLKRIGQIYYRAIRMKQEDGCPNDLDNLKTNGIIMYFLS